MAKTVSISKYLFATICALTVIFGIGFLLTLSKLSERQLPIVADISDGKWIQDGKPVSMPPDFKKYLKNNGFQSLILFDNEGGFKLVNQEGAEIIPCEIIDREGIKGCKLEERDVRLENLAEFALLRIGSNPNCVLGVHQGKAAWVHADPQAVGHLFPCH